MIQRLKLRPQSKKVKQHVPVQLAAFMISEYVCTITDTNTGPFLNTRLFQLQRKPPMSSATVILRPVLSEKLMLFNPTKHDGELEKNKTSP